MGMVSGTAIWGKDGGIAILATNYMSYTFLSFVTYHKHTTGYSPNTFSFSWKASVEGQMLQCKISSIQPTHF
jgi:hypothetical protein